MDTVADSTEKTKPLEYTALSNAISQIQKAKIDLAAKQRDDELSKVESFITENNLPRPNNQSLDTPNCFSPFALERLEIASEAIQLLPDGPIKNQVYFLFNLLNQAALERNMLEAEALAWKKKSDNVFCELIRETVIKPLSRATGGALGRGAA